MKDGAGRYLLAFLAAAGCASGGGGGAGTGGNGAGGSGGSVSGGGGGASSGGTSGTKQTATGGGPGSGGGAGSSSTTVSSGGTPATGGAGPGGLASGGSRSGGTTGGGGSTATGGTKTGGAGNDGTATGGRGGAGTGAGGTATGGTGTATGGTGSGGTGSGGATVTDTVTRTASTFAFKHFPIQTTADGVWNGPTTPGTQVSTTTYDTVVLENGYVKVTLLPKYGGRILSIVHKPTNQELLYQNPIGTPYLMGEDIFYYDYLVIMGGIFPSFPEPEHGKYWNQPFDLKVVSESSDAITVRMSRKDDLPVATGVPTKYDVGRTDVLVELDVTLRAGSTAVELGTKLTNTRSAAIPKFEYWTNTTLAPGSPPGKTAIPLNTRIVAAMDKAHLIESSWSWFGNAEERVSGEIFKWNNLSYFKNWVDQGIAYASPDYRANWSGLVNYDNSKGIVRVSDNAKTPGLKLWTFGKGSLDIDINDSTEWLRPTIEMWHGVTPEFWTRGTMSANEIRQWTDTYLPTLGMKEVTAASPHGAVYLSSSKSGTDTTLTATATLTLPKQTLKALLRVGDSVVDEQDVTVSPTDATTVSATVATSKAPAGAVFKVEFLHADKSLLTGQVTLP